MYNITSMGTDLEVRFIAPGIVRIRAGKNGQFRETLFERYGIFAKGDDLAARETDGTVECGGISVKANADGTVTVGGAKRELNISIAGYNGGAYNGSDFTLKLDLSEGERLFGLGDNNRTSIARRGTKARMDVKNVVSYGPIPYVMSSDGWGMLVSCTYVHTYDLGADDPDHITVQSRKGGVDIYLFLPESHSLQDIVELYTRIVGKPVMLPKFAYGYTYVLNEQTNCREMLWDCKMFRREKIACDMVGLEPQWMSKIYDTSIEKKWDSDRFYIPEWLPINVSSDYTFFYNLREMGFKFSLWLCNDYDMLWEEERLVGERGGSDVAEASYDGAVIIDPHFEQPRYQDQITKKDEAWFEHLKKFVDNGASAFKLDGAFQVNDHPDRLWGGRYLDDEVHNIFPVIYAKQMKEGFEDHTEGRRACIYTSCLYAGTQKYAATWAGDTGGGYDTVVAMLNYGLCGHSNVTCDMDAAQDAAIHYSFLSPWVQQLGWRNWQQPWFLSEEREDLIRYYSRLRSALIPYVYTAAHQASAKALPMARALSLIYPDVPEYDYVTNTYMLGDSLLVGVFDMNVTLPEGKWYDFWTSEVYEGGKVIDYKIPEGRGGALFVKAGSVVPMMKDQDYIDQKLPDEYILRVYPGACGENELYEDDGYTYDYECGGYAVTKFAITDSTDKGYTLTVGAREGSYSGREKRPAETYKESDPVIKGMPEVVPMRVVLAGQVSAVTLNGVAVEYTETDNGVEFVIPADVHGAGTAVVKVEY